MTTPTPRVKVTSQRRAYATVAAVTASMLCIGLAVPLALASREPTASAAGPVDTTPISVAGGQGGPAGPGAVGQAPGAAPGAVAPGVVGGPGALQVPGATAQGPGAAAPGAPAQGAPTPDGVAPGGSAPAGAGKLTASDQGVTPTSIKVGAVLLDLSKVKALGLGLDNYDTDTQQRMFDTYFNRVNEAGGINGRKIQPVYATYDPLSTSGANSGPAICVRMAKDEKVFALIGFTYTAGTCAAIQYSIPAITSNGELEQVARESHNYEIHTQPTYERMARNWTAYLLETSLSKGKKVGLVDIADGGNFQLAGDAILSTFQQLGQPITYHSRFTNDQGSASAQLPVEVQKMKAAGVEQVMLSANFLMATTFMQQAEQQNYYPQYLTSDIGALASNGLIRSGPAKSLSNLIGVTSAFTISPEGRTEQADSKDCRLFYNKTNPSQKQFAFGEEGPFNNICAEVELFTRAAIPAGTNLTRAGLVASVQRLGAGSLPNSLPGSFAAGKTNFSDNLLPARWNNPCTCYKLAGPVARARF